MGRTTCPVCSRDRGSCLCDRFNKKIREKNSRIEHLELRAEQAERNVRQLAAPDAWVGLCIENNDLRAQIDEAVGLVEFARDTTDRPGVYSELDAFLARVRPAPEHSSRSGSGPRDGATPES